MVEETVAAFEVLPIPRKELSQSAIENYRVYKSANDYVVVPAQTALEALKASGLPVAYKIERDKIDLDKVLTPNAWATSAKIEEGSGPPPPAATPEITATVSAPATDTPLSSDDVNKLLNG